MKLTKLLKAKRPDLLDGFPLKAAFKALTAEGAMGFKRTYLNSLLESEGIEVKLQKATDLMPGFREAGIVGGLTLSDGSIEILVNSTFFAKSSNLTPLERALRFQSIVSHELVHRQQFSSKTLHHAAFKDDEALSSIEYLNDPLELEAMAAEVAHDVMTASFASGAPELAQPRFNDLISNAKHITPTAMTQFRQCVANLKG
jgi:hypothetical protein